MNEIINFNYEGNEIPFKVDESGEVFMNATVMSNHFKGKSVANFLRNKSTVEYINALHEEKDDMRIRISTDSSLIQKIIGKGKEQGTWFQRNLALEFARWLNPKFSVWCNQRIDEIITKGFSALTPEATDYIDDQVGIDVEMINEIVLKIQTGVKKPGGFIKDFMKYVEGDTIKITSMVGTVHKTTNRQKTWKNFVNAAGSEL